MEVGSLNLTRRTTSRNNKSFYCMLGINISCKVFDNRGEIVEVPTRRTTSRNNKSFYCMLGINISCKVFDNRGEIVEELLGVQVLTRYPLNKETLQQI